MNRFKIFTCFTLLTLVFTSYRVKAQDMTYTLDTLRNRMFPYNLVVAAGATVDLNISGHSSAYGLGTYVRARYTISRMAQISAYYQFLPKSFVNTNQQYADNAGNVYYGYVRASLILKKSKMPQNVHFKLGQSGNYKYSADIPVGTGQYQGVTVSLNSWSGLNTVEADPHHRSWTLVDNATNRVVDTSNVSAFVKSQVIGFGYMFSQSMNFKGRFRTSGMGNKIRRKRSSLDFSAELLFAPVIRVYDRFGNNDIDANTKIHPFNVTKEAGAFDDATVAKYYFKDIQKSRVGWRFQAEMTKGIINYRFEFGSRPGLSTYLNQENEKSKFYERPLNRMYLQMGIGIGIGAL